MAYKKTQKPVDYTDLEKEVKKQGQDITSQKQLTQFFTIVVALSVVSTLVGVFGLYINTMVNTTDCTIKNSEVSEDIRKLSDVISDYQLQQVKNEAALEILKARNFLR